MPIKNKISQFVTATALLTCSSLTLAMPSDFDQPIDIEADQVTLDADSNSSIYSGNVALTRGSIKINADKLIISQTKKGSINANIYGEPATYSQLTDNNLRVDASAKRINYSSDADTVELSGEATLNRGGNIINSESITYNIRANTIRAGGASNSDETVKIRILPNQTNP